MNVKSTLPFGYCEQCEHLKANMDVTKYYSGGELIGHEITIGCEHESLCIDIQNRLLKQRGDENW